jgi:hypothetical protein
MRQMVNRVTLQGRVYDHSLTLRTVQREGENFGKEFINGTISVATDDKNLNVVQVHYTYVTPTFKSGKENRNFSILKRIMEGNQTVVGAKDGAEPLLVKIESSIDCNDFYPNGGDELVSAQRVSDGFISIIKALPDKANERNKFESDTLLIGATKHEVDPEKNVTEAYMELRAAVFGYDGVLKPVRLVVKNPAAFSYFENLEPTTAKPVLVNLWGRIENVTVKTEKTVESAFGEDKVETATHSVREWVVTGASKEPLAFGDEGVLTKDELVKLQADRETHLAEVKARTKEYEAKKKSSAPVNTAPAKIADGEFDF